MWLSKLSQNGVFSVAFHHNNRMIFLRRFPFNNDREQSLKKDEKHAQRIYKFYNKNNQLNNDFRRGP